MLSLLDQPCALVDLETTGTNPRADRITEIGLLACDADSAPQSWEQLINPGSGIPEYISRLTGITPTMVAEQPYFADVAETLWQQLQGRIFVAHNARFDYGFLKTAFRACGYDFKPQVVCTLKLSRALFPDWPRHSLDAICQAIGYPRDTRHRAMADAQALFAFLSYAFAHCGSEAVNAAVARQLKRPSLPAHLDAAAIEALPDSPGVYYFYGDNDRLLYVGKSKSLRTRIQSHFSADHRSSREMTLSQSVRRIDFTRTPGELGALLLENRHIKELAPIYNRRQRRYRHLWIWRLVADPAGFVQPKLENNPAGGWRVAGEVYGPYRNKGMARKSLQALIREHRLCNKALGLESGPGPCFGRQLEQCQGACEGRETALSHNLRLSQALAGRRLQVWPFDGPIAIPETSDDGEQHCYHIIDQWAYLGAAGDFAELETLLQQCGDNVQFDLETYRLLLRAISDGQHRIIEYTAHDPDTAHA